MKNKKYTHIKKTERIEISVLLEKGYSLRDIAKALRRSVSSVSSEIHDNSVNGKYNSSKANHKAYIKRKYSKYQGMKIAENTRLWDYVEEKLKDEWSPEIMAGRLKKIDTSVKYAGKGAIYKFIYSAYGRRLEKYLYKNSVKRRLGRKKKQETLKDRIFIKPLIILKRR